MVITVRVRIRFGFGFGVGVRDDSKRWKWELLFSSSTRSFYAIQYAISGFSALKKLPLNMSK